MRSIGQMVLKLSATKREIRIFYCHDLYLDPLTFVLKNKINCFKRYHPETQTHRRVKSILKPLASGNKNVYQ